MPPRSEDQAPKDDAPKAGRSPRAITLFVTVTILVLAADIASKVAAFSVVAGRPIDVAAATPMDLVHEPMPLLPGVLSLKLMLNEGAAFGLGQGGRWVFVVIGVVAVFIICGVFWSSRASAWLLHVALGMLLAGAVGNLGDRVAFGKVRDMLWLFPDVTLPFGMSWPGGSDQLYPWIFNIADAAMCVGLVALLLMIYRGRKDS
jgi:signal peptidase II